MLFIFTQNDPYENYIIRKIRKKLLSFVPEKKSHLIS